MLKTISILFFYFFLFSCASSDDGIFFTSETDPRPIALPSRLDSIGEAILKKERVAVEKTGSTIVTDNSEGKLCIKILSHSLVHLQTLNSFLQIEKNPDSLPKKLLEMTTAQCRGLNNSGAIALVNRFINDKNHKVGVILPLSGQRAALGQSIVNGLRVGAEVKGEDFGSFFVIRDSKGTEQGAKEALADLVFNEEVSMVIGGLTEEEAQAIAPYSKGLLLPTLMIHHSDHVIKNNVFTFQVYPRQEALAIALVSASKNKNYQRIAILKPDSGKSDEIVEAFKKECTAQGITVTETMSYIPMNYKSMEGAVANITNAHVENREEEYRRIYKAEQQKAKEEGAPFNPRSVVLPARLTADAIFIPDDFRMVQYFAKLLQYHGVTHVPLIGNHEWRSSALVQPWNPILKGAVFADFIGNYDQLPKGLSLDGKESALFMAPENLISLDMQMLGYRSASIASATLKIPFLKRSQLPKHLMKEAIEDPFFKTPQTVFNEERISRWPVYLFGVEDKNVSIYSVQGNPGSPSTPPIGAPSY